MGSGFGYIYQIGVVENWRGSGLASALLGRARKFARDHGIDRIGVGVSKYNLVSSKFFKKYGFETKYEVNGFLVKAN
jgi:ribosomal protein S18 acetylase RimI-like enzyme